MHAADTWMPETEAAYEIGSRWRRLAADLIVLWRFIDAGGRGLHHLAAGTAVVSATTVPALPRPDPATFGDGSLRGW